MLKYVGVFVVGGWLALAGVAFGQTIRAGNTTYTFSKVSGTIQQVVPGGMLVSMLPQPMLIKVDQVQLNKLLTSARKDPLPIAVAVSGDADISAAKKGMGATFSAELNEGKGVAEIQEITLFTPSPATPLSLTGTGGEQDVRGLPTGQFLVSGEIKSFGKGQMIVVVPNEKQKPMPISVKVAENVKLKARLADLSVVQPGDAVTVEGFLVSTANAGTSYMLAQAVEATLAKPLGSKAKPRTVAAADREGENARKATGRNAQQPKAGDAEKGKEFLPFAEAAPAPEKPAPVKPQPAKVAKADQENEANPATVTTQRDDPSPAELIMEGDYEVDAVTLFDDEE